MTAAGRITPPVGIQPPGARVPGVPPPLYFGAAFAAGMLLRAATVPLSVGARPPTLAVAAFLLVSGTALAVAGVIEVVRHQTTIVPHRAVSALVTTGPYRITRNPMYTGLATAYLGCALLTGSWWPVATLPFALCCRRPRCYRPRGAIPGQQVRSAVFQLPHAGAALALASTAVPHQWPIGAPATLPSKKTDQAPISTHQVRPVLLGSRLSPAAAI